MPTHAEGLTTLNQYLSVREAEKTLKSAVLALDEAFTPQDRTVREAVQLLETLADRLRFRKELLQDILTAGV